MPVAPTTGARLSNQQIVALTSADFGRPIYGETDWRRITQVANGVDCFHLRTIESIEKRGYLKSDGRGGYLLTPEGAHGLRKGMGF